MIHGILGIHITHRAVAARENAANKPPPIGAASAASSSSSAPPKVKPAAAPAKKDPKKSLKGVLVKKRSKPIASGTQESTSKADNTKTSEGTESVERQAKRRKVLAS